MFYKVESSAPKLHRGLKSIRYRAEVCMSPLVDVRLSFLVWDRKL